MGTVNVFVKRFIFILYEKYLVFSCFPYMFLVTEKRHIFLIYFETYWNNFLNCKLIYYSLMK